MNILEKIEHELQFRTSRSSGSGGQHVNKVETRVEVLFDIEGSVVLTEEQKALIRKRLHRRISKDGILIIASQAGRSQGYNKNDALKKLGALLEKALQPPVKRKKVNPLKANPEERLKAKKRQAEKKAQRRGVDY